MSKRALNQLEWRQLTVESRSPIVKIELDLFYAVQSDAITVSTVLLLVVRGLI